MKAPRSLKHNELQQVTIPRPRELYKQYGLTKTVNVAAYSGDEYLDPNLDKVEGAQLALKADAEQAKAEAEKDPKEE